LVLLAITLVALKTFAQHSDLFPRGTNYGVFWWVNSKCLN